MKSLTVLRARRTAAQGWAPAPGAEVVAGSAGPQQRTARTGEHCPLSAWWTDAAPTSEPMTVFVAEGSLMPATRGGPTTWTAARTH